MTKVGPSGVRSVQGPPAKTSAVHRVTIAAIRRISLTMMPSIYDRIEGNSIPGVMPVTAITPDRLENRQHSVKRKAPIQLGPGLENVSRLGDRGLGDRLISVFVGRLFSDFGPRVLCDRKSPVPPQNCRCHAPLPPPSQARQELHGPGCFSQLGVFLPKL